MACKGLVVDSCVEVEIEGEHSVIGDGVGAKLDPSNDEDIELPMPTASVVEESY